MTESSVGKRFGVIDDDQQRAMSGLEFVQGLVNGTLPLNTMANVARWLPGARCPIHAGHGLRANNARVQDFSSSAYHPADRPGEG
jgi:hypothetical protein